MKQGDSLVFCVLTMVFAAVGCNTVPGEKYQAVQRELQLSQEGNKRLLDQLAREQETVRQLQSQITQLRGGGKDTYDELVAPVRIELDKMSGGYDTDGKPGDDGVALFIRPVDRDGDAIKAAGSLKVTLLDLLAPSNQNVLAEYHYDVQATRKLWYGRMWTYHFTVRCPWPPSGPPAHSELTAHIVFTDLLTGRSLTAQQTFKITIPPALSTTTRPQ